MQGATSTEKASSATQHTSPEAEEIVEVEDSPSPPVMEETSKDAEVDEVEPPPAQKQAEPSVTATRPRTWVTSEIPRRSPGYCFSSWGLPRFSW